MTLLYRLLKAFNETYLRLDRELVAFGKTSVGRLLHHAAVEGRTYVDEPTDPAVIQLAQLLNSLSFVARIARQSGVQITPDGLAQIGRILFDSFAGLTDGVPAESVPIPEREEPDERTAR